MQNTYNISTGLTMDLLTGRINLEDANEFILFSLCNCLDKELEKNNTNKYFTPIEIEGYSKSKYQEEKFCDGNTFNKYKKYFEQGVDIRY